MRIKPEKITCKAILYPANSEALRGAPPGNGGYPYRAPNHTFPPKVEKAGNTSSRNNSNMISGKAAKCALP
ncbi:MAG: hypothetical protein LBB47_04250 [Spirochaetaceae bacterium]|nr:hypothetical protein [Spirochaetaceae bacterium]